MRLTFEDSRFLLHGKNGVYDIPIQRAVRFRPHADDKAEKIFKKLMLESFKVPSGGPICPSDLELFAFQRDFGIPQILRNNRSYLAHEPGLGKSAQGICAVNTKPGRTLIICPSFLRVTWAREITKWSMPNFPTVRIVPETAKRSEMDWSADYIIVSDAMISKAWVVSALHKAHFRYIFIDEIHRFKTPDALRTVALFGGKTKRFRSRGLIYEAQHVCGLSGTPMLNRSIELWPVLYAMAPELIDFMPFQDFGFRYGGARQDEQGHWTFPGSSREGELREKIMNDRFMHRVTKREVLKDLPDKIRQVVTITSDTRRPDVKALDKSLMKRYSGEPPKELGDWARVRHENGRAKVAWAAKFITETLLTDRTESAIVYAHHRDVVDALATSLSFPFNPMVIKGGVDNEVRTKIEDEFQSGRRRLIIGNIDAMNLGLTLTKATRVIFVEYAWTPALNEQAEDRAHRIGTVDSVFCQYLVLPDSIDEVILNSVLTKQERIRKVIG